MMMQHPVDLMPENIRARSQAVMVTGRYVAVTTISIVVLALAAVQTNFTLSRARETLRTVTTEANTVLNTEQKAQQLQDSIADLQAYVDRYQNLAHPLKISNVLSTVVNELPPSVTLDRLDLDVTTGRTTRRPVRSPGEDANGRQRRLVCELAGFATSDADIAETVARLQRRQPFSDVSLDFSRTRVVRERSAREFRISFKIDFEQPYEVQANLGDRESKEVARVGE